MNTAQNTLRIIFRVYSTHFNEYSTKLGNNIYNMGKTAVALSVIWYAVLLILCIAGMLSSTYSSFLYFQF